MFLDDLQRVVRVFPFPIGGDNFGFGPGTDNQDVAVVRNGFDERVDLSGLCWSYVDSVPNVVKSEIDDEK